MKHRLLRPVIAACVLAFAAGCSSDDDESPGTVANDPSPGEASGAALMSADGREILSTDLACIYRQSRGADESLSLQMQFLDSPDTIAFALYVDDPVPATPFTAVAGEQGRFSFEAFVDDVRYQDELANNELMLELEELPAPSTLSDGEMVSLRGALTMDPLSLAERASTGDAGDRTLALAANRIEIDCEAPFQLSDAVN